VSSYGSHRKSESKNRADGGTNVVNSMGYFIEMCTNGLCAWMLLGTYTSVRVRCSAVPQNAVLINSREEDIPLLKRGFTRFGRSFKGTSGNSARRRRNFFRGFFFPGLPH
jgi:hypothetical protein